MCQECIKLQQMDRCYRSIGIFYSGFGSVLEICIDGNWYQLLQHTASFDRIVCYLIDHNLIDHSNLNTLVDLNHSGTILYLKFNPITNEYYDPDEDNS